MSEVLDVTQVAQILKVSTLTERREIHDGRLEAVRVGHKLLRIRPEAVEAYLASNAIPQEAA
jgi:excisionase family DNA binding protein